MEPAIRIERTTCGLRISDSPTSGNLTPQETTTQDALDMGPDGAGLSCPGSSVVAECHLLFQTSYLRDTFRCWLGTKPTVDTPPPFSTGFASLKKEDNKVSREATVPVKTT